MQLKNRHKAVIILSLCLFALIMINFKIYSHYMRSTGKTKALFGIIEFLQYSYKYYFLIPEIIAGVLIIFSYKNYKYPFQFKATVLLFITTVIIIINIRPVWKLFIQ